MAKQPTVMKTTEYGAGKHANIPEYEHGSLIAPHVTQLSIRRPLEFGNRMRENLFVYPMLPDGVFTYQQIASSREWALGGSAEGVYKALDFLNGTESKNLWNGYIEYGLEAFLKRRVVDYLAIGRTAFGVRSKSGKLVMQYLDPVHLTMNRIDNKRTRTNSARAVTESERLWVYDGKRYASRDVVIQHPMPIGSDNYIAPLSWLLPAANLAWLLRNHNTAALDGRKIRDILMVGSPSLRDSIEQALIRLAKLYSGADVAEVGIPVVEINNMSGTPIKDLFAMVGISNVPESLDQQKFMEAFANTTASTLGIALRHIWNPLDSGNRSVEETQITREQEKGPSAFVRTEQRLINQSGFLKRATGEDVRFGFIEESDLLTLKIKADVLKAYGEAAVSFKTVFGVSISMPSFMAWMKRIGAMPLDLELSDPVDGTTLGDPDETAVESSGPLLSEDETGTGSDPNVVAMEKKAEKPLLDDSSDYGDILVDRDGYVIDRRIKIFHIPRVEALVSQKTRDDKEARLKKMRDALRDAEAYVKGGENEDIEQAVGHQVNMMIADSITLLLDRLNSGEEAEKKDIDLLAVLRNKINFSIGLSEEEVKTVEKMCDSYGINVFDSVLGVDVQ